MPHLTAPETKLIRTLEGWAVIAFNVGAVIAPIVSSVSPTQSLKWAAILNGVTMISRQGLKGVLALAKSTSLPPIEPFDPEAVQDAAAYVEQVAPEILTGTPESAITPDPEVPPVAGV